MIQNEAELRHAVQAVAAMYDLADRLAVETVGDAETRQDQVDGVKAMVRKIERELEEYFVARARARAAQEAEEADEVEEAQVTHGARVTERAA